MSDALELPSILDLIAAPGLLEAFISRRGDPLIVDGGGVQRLGAQCLQVLLAARAAWAADAQLLTMENLSDEFSATLELLGAAPENLTHRPTLDGPTLDDPTLDDKELAA
jgi:chemotaxis protein CheX